MDDLLFLSRRIFAENTFFAGGIVVSRHDGRIRQLLRGQQEINSYMYANEALRTYDYGDLVLMSGLIDSHVHVNEPGRTKWEGFRTATRAAAAGGFTTIVDMPLNSIPPTTSVANLAEKCRVAAPKIHVDVAFWGGVVPGNANELRGMIDEGVVGFKCFLCPSGVDEFPNVEPADVELALQTLTGTDSVLAFHAEVCSHNAPAPTTADGESKKYATYLKTRPASMEMDAIKLVTDMAVKYNVRTHIVHLSTADAIPLIRSARQSGARLTVETCHHYLSLSDADVPDAHTEYKCAPPIRDVANRSRLWQAICEGDIDLVVSDHSPSTPDVKMLTHGPDRGDFMRAWGGISSVQFGLSLFWTHCAEHGLGIGDVQRLMCASPAALCGLDDERHRKGRLAVGWSADFCVWDPEAEFRVRPEMIEFQNKANPYMDRVLRGVVHATVVRGRVVYHAEEGGFGEPGGRLLLNIDEVDATEGEEPDDWE